MIMKVCLVMTCLVAVTLAEPPVSGYLPPPQGSNFGADSRSASPSQSYRVPQEPSSSFSSLEARSKQAARNFQNAAFSSSFGAKPLSKFSTPSQTYLPSQRSASNQQFGESSVRAGLSQEYGVPNQRHGRLDHGNFEENSYEGNDDHVEAYSNEPANYRFQYAVNDQLHGNEFGHTESRQDEKAQGHYQVLLPDGRKQTVEYEADEAGFKPHISYEDTGNDDLARSGYDGNAQNLVRSHHQSKKSGHTGAYH